MPEMTMIEAIRDGMREAMLRDKELTNPWKKHGNIPL